MVFNIVNEAYGSAMEAKRLATVAHRFNPTLTLETVIPYLLRRGHLTQEELVERGATVHDATRRNANFLVERRSGGGLLLKQALEASAGRTVAWEARIYQAFHCLPVSHPLRQDIVPFLEYDADEGVLCLRCIRNARSLAVCHHEGRFPTWPATRIGRALATLHSLELGSLPLSDLSDFLPRRPPHAFFLHRPNHTFYSNASYATLKVVKFMQSFPEFGTLIDALREEWRPQNLVHCDVKGDNILVCEPRARLAWLIDWEMAALGDAAWDVGSMFADYLGVWLSSIPITAKDAPAYYLSLARFPLTRLQPSIRAFWKSYQVARRLTGQAAMAFLLSATRYGAVRLIQRVHEQTREAVDLVANSICQLQLSWNILAAPEVACSQLLGLDLIPSETN
jgi:hypothetical protein